MFEQDPYFLDNNPKKPEAPKEQIEFQRLAYEVFKQNKDGAKLYALIQKYYLDRSIFSPNSPTSQHESLLYAGFKEAFYMLRQLAEAHERKINGV